MGKSSSFAFLSPHVEPSRSPFSGEGDRTQTHQSIDTNTNTVRTVGFRLLLFLPLKSVAKPGAQNEDGENNERR